MLKSVKKKNTTKRFFLGLIIFLSLFLLFNQVNAQPDVGLQPVGEEIQLGTADLRVTIARIIRAFLGFLGVVAVALVIYGGYLYMTAQGVAEKIDKAKKTLVAAVIGLVIVLSAFAIASFVLNQLLQATGPAGGPGDDDVGPGDDDIPGGVEEFCANPSFDEIPWLCIKEQDQTAQSDSLITLYGGNVSDTPGRIYFTDRAQVNQYDAEIVTCKEDDVKWFKDISNSDLQKVKVRVPQGLDLTENDYWVVAETDNGLTINKVWQGYVDDDRLDRFTYEAGDNNAPNIICFTTEIPDNGDFAEGPEIDFARQGDRVRIKGERFGTVGTVVYNSGDTNDSATINDWQETYVSTIVPPTASGDVRVTRDDNAYDEDYLVILCNTGSDCGTNCCQRRRGRNVCVAEENCLNDEGEACFDGVTCTEAEFGCRSDLFCDPTDCTCKRRGQGAPCDATPETASCEADDTLCGDEFYCSTIEACTCQYLPRIDGFDPEAGGPGNFVSVYGRGFGTEINTTSKIIFLGADTDGDQNPEGDADDLEAILPMNCGTENVWQDNQIIIEIPDGAVSGPLKLINSDGLEETTMDSDGIVADFEVDPNINYPSLCSVDPDQGEFGDSVNLAGKNFGNAADGQVLIGGLEFSQGDNWDWFYDPADELDKINDAVVPNIEPDENLPVQVRSGDTYSNSFNFTVIESGKAPRIDYIDPNRATVGQYVTIYGSNFGQEEGLVKFRNASGDFIEADLSFPEQCLNNLWHDTYIIVKVPGLGPGNPLASEVIVETQNSGNTNTVDFERCILNENTCPLRPGICLIEPNQGPVGTEINIYGDNFLAHDANSSQVVFWNNQSIIPAPASWSNQQIGPLNVPNQANTGPVSVVSRLGLTSNQMPFTVADCRDDNTICDTANTGNICCETDGVCKTTVECYGEKPPMCFYSWSFATGQAPQEFRPPQVVEDIECNENTQSPSPWKDSDSNCVNANISARFNRLMNASTFTTNNIIVRECWAEDYFDEELGSECEIPSWHNQDRNIYPINEENGFYRGFIYEAPVNALQPGRWYEVTLKSSNGDYIKSREGLWLDGDFDSSPGGDYRWYFRIKDSAEECSLEKVLVNPNEATIETITDTQEYSATALAVNCNILNGNLYNWEWYKIYSDGAREVGPVADPQACDRRYCIAEISESDENNDGNIDWRQIASPLKQGFTFVSAAAENKSDENNELIIDLNIPEIYRIYPDNGLINPDVNSYVTIYGNNFGNIQRNSKVFFDNVEAEIAPDCPAAWTDSQIQVIVPNPTPIEAANEPTYDLTGINEDEDMVIFYDMDEDSNVILQDKADNNDGEIFGAEKVASTFGNALSFNGQSDYVKLPNNYNLSTGSVELWFKPNFTTGQKQTLFSISDGTADNILALEIDPVDQDNANFALTLNTASGQANNSTLFNVLENDNWHHLVFTYDGNEYYFYINGRKFYYFNISNIAAPNQTDLWFNANIEPTNVLLGAKNTGEFLDYYDGLMEGFAIYSTVLSEDQVRSRYGLQAGQILLLNFEGIGDEIIDSSANNFTNLKASDAEFRIDEGRYGKGFADSIIAVEDNPSLNFKDQISIEGWFKVADFNQPFTIFESNRISLGNLNNNCGSGLQFCFKLALVNEDNLAVSRARWASLEPNKIRNNAWNYFAAVYDGQTIKLYLNDEVPAEWLFDGRIYQHGDFGYATIGSSTGDAQFDNLAVYNRALTESEVNDRIGAKNGANVIVQTKFGSDDSLSDTNQLFYHSDIVYPFLCQLQPNIGLEGTSIAISGDNFGDSNKTIYQGLEYDLGSLVYFDMFNLLDENIGNWTNGLVNAINPFSDIGVQEIPVSISIDPFAEPFIDEDDSGIYNSGEQYADILEPFGEYNQGFYEVEKFDPEDIGQTGIIETEAELVSNALPFYFSPVITKITPDNGPEGQWVTIHGYNFGHNPGEVYFFNDLVAEFPPEPCESFWTNTQIIVVVPEGSQPGDVYLITEQGLQSNQVAFEVNDNPLGAGICQIEPNMGIAGSNIIVKGDRFDEEGDGQGEDQLLFNDNKSASVSGWQNRTLSATVPTGAIDGNVVVTKRREVDRQCAGFSIGSWCPSDQYDIIYEDIPSNPVYFNVFLGCEQAGTGEICTDVSEEPGFPIRPYYSQGDVRNLNVDVGVLATDGTYLYARNWAGESYSYGGNISGVNGSNIIYKIGTGYNGTDLGKIYKEYVWRDKEGVNPLVALSMTYHSDNNFYIGHNIIQDSQYFIPRIIFDDENDEFYLENIEIADYLFNSGNADTETNHKGALISSNGRFIFNVAIYGSTSNPDGYRVKIFDPQNNWRKVKEFEVSNSEQIKALPLSNGMVVAGDIIYVMSRFNDIVAINWQNEDWVESWETHNNSTFEINGQYDWLNNVFWVGELAHEIDPTDPSNQIHRYPACPLEGEEFCRADTDCEKCGPGTSSCVNGRCTPYITSFIPDQGPVGSWVDLYGCYFGCDQGTILFTDDKPASLINDPECADSWQCDTSPVDCPGIGPSCDRVQVEVPDQTTPFDENDDAVTGPITLITALGLRTETDFDFVVTDEDLGHQICNLMPDYGNRGITVRIHGENFEETGGDINNGDYVYFGLGNGLTAREPWSDSNNDGNFTAGEAFIDFNNNGQYDISLNDDEYSFNISNYVSNATGCPDDGWSDKDICFTVPNNIENSLGTTSSAAGQGNNDLQAINNVKVFKANDDNNDREAFALNFGDCGNQIIEPNKGEQCDGISLPNLSCCQLGFAANKICQNNSEPCTDDADCPGSVCVDACEINCTNQCSIEVCDEITGLCSSLDQVLCGNGNVDSVCEEVEGQECLEPPVCQQDNQGNDIIIYEEECDDNNTVSGDGCDSQCRLEAPEIEEEVEGPQVEATVPVHGDEGFCRNGIIDVYFNSLINSATITKDNIKLQTCTNPVTKSKKGLLAGFWYNLKDVFKKLIGLERQALAQLNCGSFIDITDFDFNIKNRKGRTILSILPNELLERDTIYRIRLAPNIENLTGGSLDNLAGEPDGTPIDDGSGDYIFDFKTLGEAGDELSGICNVEWININVYRHEYAGTDPPLTDRESELRNNDLFICAGRDDCNLEVDYDQDSNTSGNQHIYEAIAKYSGGYSLKAEYQWSKTVTSDPQNVLTLYNNQEDLETDPDRVKNNSGIVYTTAEPIKEAKAQLVIEAQAAGSWTTPAQQNFLVYVLLCENPWPSINERFPVSSLINAYNFELYYCRDAGRPGDPSDDLPAAKWLFPEVADLTILENTDFEFGSLRHWVPSDGSDGDAFMMQPVFGDITLARDGISSKIQGNWWISTKENYHGYNWEDINSAGQGFGPIGVLHSQAFLIEGDEIRFLIGGSQTDSAILDSFTDIESPPNGLTSVVLAVKDDPEAVAGEEIVRKTTGPGITTMQQASFDTSQFMAGRSCQSDADCNNYGICECDGECGPENSGQCSPVAGIIYIYDNDTAGYINFDDLNQYKQGVEIPIRFTD
ncbi:MAG: hypothetical protein GF365_00105 [Candidatus Buchananbacteria bacterium]|nr:hypothetical protein [Candidatus Buchananbacteria bacterium]